MSELSVTLQKYMNGGLQMENNMSILEDIKNGRVQQEKGSEKNRRIFSFSFDASLYPDFVKAFGKEAKIKLIHYADLSWDEKKDRHMLWQMSKHLWVIAHLGEKEIKETVGICKDIREYWEEDGYFYIKKQGRQYMPPVYLPCLSEEGSIEFRDDVYQGVLENLNEKQKNLQKERWWNSDDEKKQQWEKLVEGKFSDVLVKRAIIEEVREFKECVDRYSDKQVTQLDIKLRLDDTKIPLVFKANGNSYKGNYELNNNVIVVNARQSALNMKPYIFPDTPKDKRNWLETKLIEKMKQLKGETVDVFMNPKICTHSKEYYVTFYCVIPDIAIGNECLSGETQKEKVQKYH